MSTWWERATTEDRIAQIKGGIECGMTAGQIATNCRTTAGSVQQFSFRHGISIPRVSRPKEQQTIAGIRFGQRIYGWSQADNSASFELFGERQGRTEIFSFEGV